MFHDPILGKINAAFNNRKLQPYYEKLMKIKSFHPENWSGKTSGAVPVC